MDEGRYDVINVEDLKPDLKLLNCDNCDFNTQDMELLTKHRETHKTIVTVCHTLSKGFKKLAKDLLKCQECEEWFTTEDKLQNHTNRFHNKSPLNCNKCEFSTKDPKHFLLHYEQHIKDRLVCSVAECMATFEKLTDLREHSVSVHQRINCDKCQKSFKLQSSLFEHYKKVHTTDEDCLLQCPVCSLKYNCRTRYEKHIKTHVISNRFHCQHCEQTFNKEVSLEVHINKDHNNSKPFICDICNKQFYANEKLFNHLSNKHKIAVYGCDSCKYNTNSKYKMARHQLTHSSHRYKCDVKSCDQTFETKYNLTIHKKINHSIESEIKSNLDNNSDISMSLKSNPNYCSDSFESQMSVKSRHLSEDNNKEFIPVTDFLEIDLKSEDIHNEVIQLDDSSGAEDSNNFVDNHSEYDSRINSFQLTRNSTDFETNSEQNDKNLSENPILAQILQNNCQNLGENFNIVYNKSKNSLLINQNCPKTTVKTIGNSLQNKSISDIDCEEVDDNEEEVLQSYCTVSDCQELLEEGKTLRDHMLSVHKLIKCNKCVKCFQSFSGLYKHKRRYHRSQRQIVCRFCDKTFFYLTSYEKHIETHDRHREDDPNYHSLLKNSAKSYSCNECNELFVERHKYLSHLSKIHSIPAFNCDLCDYKSMSKKLLSSHMVRHSTAKPFKCDINACNMSFKSRNSLQIHKRVKHMNQIRFVCQWTDCGKQFSMKTLYDYHMSSHSNEKLCLNESNSNTNDSDINQSFVDSNLIQICGQNNNGFGFENVKQEPIDDNSEYEESADNEFKNSFNFSLITELMRRNEYKIKTEDNNCGQNTDICGDYTKNIESTINQNLLCFECNQTFGSFDSLYRHNNEFHNKYKPKYK